MPLISVIIPVYNGEKTIQKTIESVSKQTFKDFEIIIINDGSQDSTLKIIEEIYEPRIKVFSYPNGGVAASRNRGVSHAFGEFIAFLDADDLWTPDKLELQLKALQENPQAAVAYSWSNFIDEYDQFLHRGSYFTANGNVYEKLLVFNFLENGSNPLIRRQALTEVGIFEESLPPADEWDMWIRLAAKYQFVAVQSPQILYRVSVHSQSSSNISKLEKACLIVIDRAFSQAPESLQSLKKRSLGRIYKYLTFKNIEGPPKRENGISAIRCFLQAIKNDPSILRQSRVLLTVFFKVGVALLLPSQQGQALLSSARSLYRKYNPSH